MQDLVKLDLKRGLRRCSISAKGQCVHGNANIFGCHQFSKKLKIGRRRQKNPPKTLSFNEFCFQFSLLVYVCMWICCYLFAICCYTLSVLEIRETEMHAVSVKCILIYSYLIYERRPGWREPGKQKALCFWNVHVYFFSLALYAQNPLSIPIFINSNTGHLVTCRQNIFLFSKTNFWKNPPTLYSVTIVL